jgi:plasmid maintenance system antidote protein VapI
VAGTTGLAQDVVTRVLDDTVTINETIADRLFGGLGIIKTMWLNCQARYKADLARSHHLRTS